METQNSLISIIVPVYNTEKYLPKCINSILVQTYTDFELILIDDGSTDNSSNICDYYLNKDERIRVIHQKNSGVTNARANGVATAEGEFVTFVDSDDTIPIDAIQTLHSQIRPDIDIVVGKIYSEEKFPLDNDVENAKSIIGIETYRKIQLLQTLVYQSGPCTKLFRKKLFDQNTFMIPRNITIGEDWIMNIRLAFKANQKVCFINKVVYNYTKHESSVTNNYQINIGYETLFFKYYMLSIPKCELDKYMPITIEKRLSKFIELTRYSIFISKDGQSFYEMLARDIKNYKYKMRLKEKLQFYIKNPCLRFLLVLMRRVINR